MLKKNSIVCFRLKEGDPCSVKSSMERWNKISVLYVLVVWFDFKEKVNPRFIGLFSIAVVSLRPSRIPTRCTHFWFHLVWSEYLGDPEFVIR